MRMATRVLSVSTIAVIIYLSIVPGGVDLRGFPSELGHGLAYLGAGFLMILALKPGIAAFATTTLALVSLAAALEAAQAWIPGRHPSLLDFGLGAAGAITGTSIGAWLADGLSRLGERWTARRR